MFVTVHNMEELDHFVRGTRSFTLAAMDGPCGSGKTTLAKAMADTFGWQVVHIDDFYKPWNERSENWKDQIAGNMDLKRLNREILIPLHQKQHCLCRPYLCRENRWLAGYELMPEGVVVVEGNYSFMPLIESLYNIRLYLDCPEKICMDRLSKREGMNLENFLGLWLPLEKRYIETMKIREKAQIIVRDMEMSVEKQ